MGYLLRPLQQHVIGLSNRNLRSWVYRTVRADLLGQKNEVPFMQVDDATSLTY